MHGPIRLDVSHVLAWPPQPTTVAGVLLVALALLQPELAVPALVSGLVAILGDDGSDRGDDARGDAGVFAGC